MTLSSLPGHGIGEGELELGHVMGAFGVRGEVRLFLHHRETDLLDRPRDVVLVAPDGRRFSIRLSVRSGAGKRILGRIEGLEDCDEAAALRDHVVVIPKAALPALEPGEFYLWQVEGADVLVDGASVGRVEQVQSTAGGEVLVIRVGQELHFVPCIKELVTGVEVDAGVVHLSPDALEEG